MCVCVCVSLYLLACEYMCETNKYVLEVCGHFLRARACGKGVIAPHNNLLMPLHYSMREIHQFPLPNIHANN